MSENKSFSTETSERYSRALFEVVKDSNEIEKTEMDVKTFQFLLKNSVELKNFIHNPTLSLENQNVAISLVSEKLNFSKNLKNFFFLLIKKRRIFFTSKILDSFLRLCSKKRGEIRIDKELIGGLKLQLGSFMIDTSIKNKLKKLEERMLES